jgi:hypothetical protein
MGHVSAMVNKQNKKKKQKKNKKKKGGVQQNIGYFCNSSIASLRLRVVVTESAIVSSATTWR